MTHRLPPRMPSRPRRIECYPDCLARETENGDDCRCGERDDAAWEAEGDRRATEWRERDEREEEDGC